MIQTEIKNPYNKLTQEGDYLNYDSGWHSRSENECPYDPDDPDTKSFLRAWKKGFKANLEHSKTTSIVTGPDDLVITPNRLESNSVDLETISTELLELELKKRKLVLMREYLEQREELYSKLQLLQSKIDKLSILTGESE